MTKAFSKINKPDLYGRDYIYMMRPGLVSVVLCSFNGERFIVPQIESILEQDYPDFELIIADDASVDNTRKILGRYESHPKIRIIYRAFNLGLTRNFEAAAKEANGEWIAFADQDDIWLRDKLSTLVASIGNYPLVYSDSLLVDENGKSLEKKLSGLKKMYTGNDSRGYIFYSCVWGHGMLVTRKLLLQSLPMPSHVNHDIWLTFQAFLHGGILYVDRLLTMYRQHDASYSKTLPPRRIRGLKKEKRYKAYKEKLRWIRLMMEHERPEYKPFYNEFHRLFALREHKAFVWPLISFMMKHRKSLFMLSMKGRADHVIEILKYGIGERPPA